MALLVLTASCKDEGVQHHQQALEKYSECVTRGVRPTDPCFAEVLTILDRIPKSSTARPPAEVLRAALLTAQQPRLGAPLAVPGAPQCQQLAEQLGTTAEADRPAKLRALEECRAKVEKAGDVH